MEAFLSVAVEVLRLVPLILLFYIPALLGMATLRERGESYRVKAALWFALGLGVILAIQVVFTSASALQVAATVGISLAQVAVALLLAAFTVYKLAD